MFQCIISAYLFLLARKICSAADCIMRSIFQVIAVQCLDFIKFLKSCLTVTFELLGRQAGNEQICINVFIAAFFVDFNEKLKFKAALRYLKDLKTFVCIPVNEETN
jgi:hypothetical protein